MANPVWILVEFLMGLPEENYTAAYQSELLQLWIMKKVTLNNGLL